MPVGDDAQHRIVTATAAAVLRSMLRQPSGSGADPGHLLVYAAPEVGRDLQEALEAALQLGEIGVAPADLVGRDHRLLLVILLRLADVHVEVFAILVELIQGTEEITVVAAPPYGRVSIE